MDNSYFQVTTKTTFVNPQSNPQTEISSHYIHEEQIQNFVPKFKKPKTLGSNFIESQITEENWEVLKKENPQLLTLERLGKLTSLYAPFVEDTLEKRFTRDVALEMLQSSRNSLPKMKEIVAYSAFGFDWEMRVDLCAYKKRKEGLTGCQTWVGLTFHGTNDVKLYPPGVSTMELDKNQNPDKPHRFHVSKAHEKGIEGYYRLNAEFYLPEITPMVQIATKWLKCTPEIRVEYNPEQNRTDIDCLDFKNRLSVTFNFEPHPPYEYSTLEDYTPVPQSFYDHIEKMEEDEPRSAKRADAKKNSEPTGEKTYWFFI